VYITTPGLFTAVTVITVEKVKLALLPHGISEKLGGLRVVVKLTTCKGTGEAVTVGD
jgi:hypothetical protein